MDAAKALALGADVVALARPLPAPAIESAAAVTDVLSTLIENSGSARTAPGRLTWTRPRRIGVRIRRRPSTPAGHPAGPDPQAPYASPVAPPVKMPTITSPNLNAKIGSPHPQTKAPSFKDPNAPLTRRPG